MGCPPPLESPLSPPPPLPDPVVVPVVVGVVAWVVVAGVVVAVVVVVWVVVGLVAAVVVGTEVAVVAVVVTVLVVRQSRAASWLTVETPWSRSSRSVALIVEGSFATALARLRLALLAPAQSPAATADETWLSWLLSPLAWSLESRPAPPPQAAMSEVANPSPPARSARNRERIRRLTLEAASVWFALATLTAAEARIPGLLTARRHWP
jgi:hypothetical protein